MLRVVALTRHSWTSGQTRKDPYLMPTRTLKKLSALLLLLAMHAAYIVLLIVCTSEQGTARVSVAARKFVMLFLWTVTRY